MADALTHLKTTDFHVIKRIKNKEAHLYIGHEWQPQQPVFIVGATMGLLCFTANMVELYLSISPSPNLEPRDYFAGLKQGYWFYAQRDQRDPPRGQQDLVKDVFLPAGTGFFLDRGQTIYYRCGAINKSGRTVLYDIFATLYYVEVLSAEGEPIPRVEPEAVALDQPLDKPS